MPEFEKIQEEEEEEEGQKRCKMGGRRPPLNTNSAKHLLRWVMSVCTERNSRMSAIVFCTVQYFIVRSDELSVLLFETINQTGQNCCV
jgi:hypothetical protein